GVGTDYIKRTDEANTALAFVSLKADGQRDFSFYRKPSADMLYEAQNIEDLDQHATIADPHFGQMQKWRLQKENAEPLFIKPKAKLLLNDLQAIKNAALAGAGIAWLPDWLIQNELQEGKLVQVLETMSSIAFPIHLVWPTLPFMPLKTRLAIDYLAQHLPPELNKQA
ncbi:MAG: LysR substrate-binding domain-containing protein, partial [Acinetobacter sp.]|nr:LysR substrate-binding domain-containing protein [Acinetobacter sp.]